MATKLLNCLICPKRPDFSDVSHLLTHVSSKGHLSHLHKLQVRSHQEIAAGHQLAIYNQWYQEHDLGRLLSERMQQKDGKSVNKKERIKQENVVIQAPVYSSNNVFENPVLVRAPRFLKQAKHEFKQESSDDDSLYLSSPLIRDRAKRPTRLDMQAASKKVRWETRQANPIDLDSSVGPDLSTPATPEVAKLKGVKWPGMDLFDSASDVARRKRNQKKDGSVLEQMEKTSAMIEPYEVIYSSGGTKLKERFIDGNVDSSSPLRGETPIPKSQLAKKRQPLAPVDANAPRNARISTRISKPRTMAEVRNNAKPIKMPRKHAPSSSIEDVLESTPQFSPTANKGSGLKFAVNSVHMKTTIPNFTIYRDEDAPSAIGPVLGANNPFNATPDRGYQDRQHLSFITAPWLQPQNQYLAQPQYGNPYMAFTRDGRAYPEFDQLRSNPFKLESPPNFGIQATFSPIRPNWPYRPLPSYKSKCSPIHSNHSFFGGFNAQDDPFGYAKNPLSAAPALDHATTEVEAYKARKDACTPSPVKNNSLALNDPLSEVEKRRIYEHALFPSSQ